MIRSVKFHRNYFLDFYNELDQKVQEKIEYIFYIIRNSEFIPAKFFKHIESTDGLYEIRIQSSNNIFRIFCFFDEGQLVILLHGFQKKTQKTPRKEITRTEKLKQEYYADKKTKNEKAT